MKTETNIAAKIDQLLARVAGVKRGSECPRPTRFNRRGQRPRSADRRPRRCSPWWNNTKQPNS